MSAPFAAKLNAGPDSRRRAKRRLPPPRRPRERRPRREERDAAERASRREAANAGQREHVEAAGEQHDSGDEAATPRRRAQTLSGLCSSRMPTPSKSQRVPEVILHGGLAERAAHSGAECAPSRSACAPNAPRADGDEQERRRAERTHDASRGRHGRHRGRRMPGVADERGGSAAKRRHSVSRCPTRLRLRALRWAFSAVQRVRAHSVNRPNCRIAP